MTARPTRSRRILIIDASQERLERMARALVDAGYEVITTTQVVGNARHLARCELIVVDFHMPGLNGAAIVESMRTVGETRNHRASFYLYTTDATASADYARLGFDGAFTSKGDDADLVRQVAAFFRGAARRDSEPAPQ